MGRTGAFGAFAAAAAEPAHKHNSSREVSRPSKNGTTPAPAAPARPVPELGLAEVRALLEELRTVSSSEKFQKDLQHLRSLDWGAFKKREAVAKLLSIFWKAPLRRFGFSIDGQGFPHLLQVVKANGQRPGIRLVSHEVEKKLRMVPGTLFGLTGDVKSWKEDEVQKTDGKTHAPAVSNGKVAKDLRGRPMFLGEAKELLKAFKEALLSPAILRTMQNIEQKGGVHMDQHRRVLITQEWNPIMKRFDFPVTEAGYEAMKTGIRQFAENEYVRSSCHEVEGLCGAPPGSYFGVPTAEEMAEQKRKVEEARRAEENKKAEEEARQKKEAERRRAEEEKKRKEEEEARKREEAKRQQEEAEASKKREEEAAERREQEETRRRKEEEEEMSKQKEEEEASKKKEEEVELHRRQEEEEASRRKEEEEAAERREQEEARRRKEEEEEMSKQQKEEEEASKKEEEEASIRRKEEEEASERREQEEARRRKEEEEETSKQKEEEEASKKEEEEASRRKEEEEASQRREQEEAKTRKEEEEMSKQKQEEEASKKKEEEVELHRRQEEEEASRRKEEEEEASQRREQEEATETKKPEEEATTKEADASRIRHQEELKANLSDVSFEKMPIKEANRLNGVSENSFNEYGAIDSVSQVLEDELTGQCFEAVRRLPLLRAADATADAVGVVQASAVLRGIVEGQWLRVLHSSCRALGALADIAYLPLEELKSAESCRPFPMGTAGRFKVSAPRVAVRAHPELRGKVVGVVVSGRMLMGTPHKVAGYLWLRFEESSRKKVGEEEAWALIQGLAGEVLLEPLDADGRRVLANFQGQGCPAEMPVADPVTGTTGAKMPSVLKPPPAEKLPTPVTDPVKVSQRVDGAALARKQLKGPLEFRVLAEDHSAPVRKEPLVQSPQVGKLERGELVYGYPGGGWLQLARSDLENSWVFIGTRLSAVWAELRVTARSWNALEVTWPGLYQEKRVAYNVEWRTPEGNTKQMKGHKVSMSNKVVLGNLPSGLLCFRVGARVAGGGNNDEQDVRLWGPWTELEAGEM